MPNLTTNNFLKIILPFIIAISVFYTPLSFSADGDLSSMTAVGPQDKSVQYLRYIFGDTVQLITGGSGPTEVDSIMGAISEVLNIGMLAFTGLIIGYVVITGIMNSANEGTPLGKSYSTMWIPMRMILALALVLPFVGGYSAMQIGVLKMAGHGVGLANTTWSKALGFLQANGTLYPSDSNLDSEELAARIIESKMCKYTTNRAWPNTIETKQLNSVTEENDEYIIAFKDIGRKRKTKIDCGGYELTLAQINNTTIEPAQRVHREQYVKALSDLTVTLDDLARELYYWRINKATDPSIASPDPKRYRDAIDLFNSKIKENNSEIIGKLTDIRMATWNNGDPKVSGMDGGIRSAGWITAGAWYWDFQRINNETNQILAFGAKATPVNIIGEKTHEEEFASIRKEYEEDLKIFTSSSGVFESDLPDTVTVNDKGESTYNVGWLDESTAFVFRKFIVKTTNILYDSPDPVSGLSSLGHIMLNVIASSMTVAIISNANLTALSRIAESIPWVGKAASAPPEWAKSALKGFFGVFLMYCILLIPLALMLAFYLPATPMILWIMGVAAWYVMVIESMVAAPIWAASHAMPEGNSFVGQRAMAGYMVLLSLFLRPTLMLFGFFASMTLMIVMGKVLFLLFLPGMSSINANTLSGPFTFIGMFYILVSLVIQISHRCYGLIHELPDKVLRYIGGGQENLGEAKSEAEGRQSFIGAAAVIKQGAMGNKKEPKKPKPETDDKK